MINIKLDMIRLALFSECDRYRWKLSRQWELEGKTVLFIMLNPSTANATTDDPTIRKCISYAKKWGYARLEVVNLFGYVSSDPKVIERLPQKEAVGPENDDYLFAAAKDADMVVLAWGAHGILHGRDWKVRVLLSKAGIQAHYLKLGSTGIPCHPLYLKGDLTPQPFA